MPPPGLNLATSIVQFLKSDSISRWLASDFSVNKIRKVGDSYVTTLPGFQDKIPEMTHEVSFWATPDLVRDLLDNEWFDGKKIRICFYERKEKEKEVIAR